VSGKNVEVFRTDWGWCGIAAGDAGLKRIVAPWRYGREDVLGILRGEYPHSVVRARGLSKAAGQLKKYFAGKLFEFEIPLDPDGLTRFQKSVLRSAKKIPYGGEKTYSQIARSIGSPGAARAIGGALARNPLPVVIPCHRVITARGAPGGFSASGGTEQKILLLLFEAVNLSEVKIYGGKSKSRHQ